MDVEDDLREITAEDLGKENPPSRLKTAIIMLAGIVLVLLLVSYFVPRNIFYIFEGRLVSEKLNLDFSINLKNGGKVVFEKAAYEKLKELYFAEQKNEFKACLLGKKTGRDYFISGLYLPKTFSQTFSEVTAELCSKETIISLHTHPYKRCIFSEQDVKSYEAGKLVNPDMLIGLMCESGRFGFYGY